MRAVTSNGQLTSALLASCLLEPAFARLLGNTRLTDLTTRRFRVARKKKKSTGFKEVKSLIVTFSGFLVRWKLWAHIQHRTSAMKLDRI